MIIFTLLLIYLLKKIINESFDEYKIRPIGYNKKQNCNSINNLYNSNSKIINSIPTKILQNKLAYISILEISIDQLNKILKSVVKKNELILSSDKEFREVSNYTYNYYNGYKKYKLDKDKDIEILNYVMNEINKELYINKLNKGLNNGYFTIKDYSLISIEKNKKKDMKYVYNIYLHRLNKGIIFEIQVVCIIREKKIYITEINVIGNFTQDKLINGYKIINYPKIYRNYPYIKKFNNRDYYRYSIDTDLDITDYKTEINNKKKLKKEYSEFLKYKCYNKGDIDKNSKQDLCQSEKALNRKSKPQGIWDKVCEYDSECPFWKANKNYPNNFGGCVKGECELPINMKNISPHLYNYSEKNKPYCYNCINKYDCCELQKDKKIYPKLVTPDYAYPNDYKLRTKYKKRLSKRNLYTNKNLIK